MKLSERVKQSIENHSRYLFDPAVSIRAAEVWGIMKQMGESVKESAEMRNSLEQKIRESINTAVQSVEYGLIPDIDDVLANPSFNIGKDIVLVISSEDKKVSREFEGVASEINAPAKFRELKNKDNIGRDFN